MTTSRIQIDEGSTTSLATNTFSEDAVTKHVARSVLNTSAGVESGTVSSPLRIDPTGTTDQPIISDQITDLTEVNSYTSDKELRVFSQSHICNENTTSTPLSGGAVFTGAWQDCLDYAEVIVSVTSNVASATDGLAIYWSADGTNIIGSDVFTISAGAQKTFSFQTVGRYVKVVYTNDGSAQSTFHLLTLLKRFASKGSSHRLKDQLSQEDDGIVTKSLISGFSSSGGGTLVDVKVNPSGALTVESTLATGSNLIGKVGIDQTTPGTTNKVTLGSDVVHTIIDSSTELGSVTETAPASDTATSGLNGRLQRIAQRLTSLIGLFPTSLGQKTKSNSFPVVISSDQDTLPVSLATVPTHDVTNAGTFATQAQLQAGTALAGKISAGHDTSTVYNGTTALTPKFAKIDISASADIVALVSSKKIRVISMFLISSADCTIKFQSGATTDLQGAMTIKAGAGFVLGQNLTGWFETASGEKLNAVVSGTTQISGSLTYIEV